MNSFNLFMGIGNVTWDPQVKQIGEKGTTVAEFGLALNKKSRTSNGAEREEVCFVNVLTYGKRAEFVARAVKRGTRVMVRGELVYDTWEKEGKKFSRHRIRADGVEVMERREHAETGADGNGRTSGGGVRVASRNGSVPQPALSAAGPVEDPLDAEDDRPF